MCERHPATKTEAFAARALSFRTKWDNCAGQPPLTVLEKSVTRMRNRKSLSVGAVSRYPISCSTKLQNEAIRSLATMSDHAFSSASRLATPSCKRPEKRRCKMPGRSGCSALANTAIILRSRSPASSLGATQRLRRSTRSLDLRNLARSFRCARSCCEVRPRSSSRIDALSAWKLLLRSRMSSNQSLAGSGAGLAL